MIVKLLIGLNSSFIYVFIIIITIVLFMGHVLSCWIVSIVLVCTEPWVASPLVLHTVHHLLHVDVIVSKMLPWVAAF